MITAKTKHDIAATLWGAAVTIPASTEVVFVRDGWVVKSARLLVELTGNQQDPYFRNAWVRPEDVESPIFDPEAP